MLVNYFLSFFLWCNYYSCNVYCVLCTCMTIFHSLLVDIMGIYYLKDCCEILYTYMYWTRVTSLPLHLPMNKEIPLVHKYCYTSIAILALMLHSTGNQMLWWRCYHQMFLAVIKRGGEISEIQRTKNIIFIIFLLFPF